MNEVRVPSLFGALIAVVTALLAVEVYGKREIHLWSSGSTGASVQVQGSADDDWLIQSSTNLLDWTTPENVGPLLGGDTNAPLRELPASNANHQFYRALRTEGLYDSSLLRTFSLTFSQWVSRCT
ncbi:MAG TPA: hypothetical protein VMF06_13425 [Candidatus Limnocylindria bacterium]|jgi:hypothetical protein|nr:hypothetical protein [Candidatus Limnocylindria bacterium]